LLGRACGFEISRYMSVVITRRAARQFRAVAPTVVDGERLDYLGECLFFVHGPSKLRPRAGY
jgi:hypothetical protein